MISICNRFQPCKMIILKGSFTMFLAIKIDLVSFLTNFIPHTHDKKDIGVPFASTYVLKNIKSDMKCRFTCYIQVVTYIWLNIKIVKQD